jgi:hypothetical protein
MKKHLLSLASIFISGLLVAQTQIPNAGFENWNGQNITGWGNSDAILSGLGQPDPGGVERETVAANVYAGASSVKVTTKQVSVFGQSFLLPGVVSLGTLSLNLQTQTPQIRGFAYTDRPDSFSFYYKYTSSNSGLDTGAAVVTLTKFDNGETKTIGQAFLTVTNQAAFTQVKGKIVYSSIMTPDTLLIQLLSSASFGGGFDGTTMWADELQFHGLDTAFKAYMTPRGSETICAGETIDLEGDNISGFQYRWLLNNSPISSATSFLYTANTSGFYSLEVTNSNGQIDTSEAFELVVFPLPTVSLLGNPDTLCSSASPIALVGGSPMGGTYSGNGVAGPNFNPAAAGNGPKTITYTYEDMNGCENSATEVIVVRICASIEDIAKEYNVDVFPNPSSNVFSITSDDRLRGGEIVISDINGRIVSKRIIESDNTSFDASKWSTGNYIFQINTGNKSIVGGKINIQK